MTHLSMCDLNHDGLQDYVVAYTNPGVIDVRINGGSALGIPQEYTFAKVQTYYDTMGCVDMNNDGHLDVVVLFSTTPMPMVQTSNIAVFSGNGGNLNPLAITPVITTTPLAGLMALGDINNDHFADVGIIVNSNTLYVLNGSGSGALTPATPASYYVGEGARD